jgi:hypothetical protein
MADEKKHDADRAAEQIFLPDPKTVKFLGHSIRLRPVPVAVAKELRRFPERLQKVMEGISKNPTPEGVSETDFAAADLYVDTCYRLLQFYKIEIPKEELAEKATLSELKSLVDEQSSVQGDEDFLFGPLRNTTRAFFPQLTENKTRTYPEGSS